MGVLTRAAIGGFIGKVVGTIFVTACAALGFGPQKWVAFVIAGLPHSITPQLTRVILLILGAITAAALIYSADVRGLVMGWKKKFFRRQAERVEQMASANTPDSVSATSSATQPELPAAIQAAVSSGTAGIRVTGKHNEFAFNVVLGTGTGIDMGHSEHSIAHHNYIEGPKPPTPDPAAPTEKK